MFSLIPPIVPPTPVGVVNYLLTFKFSTGCYDWNQNRQWNFLGVVILVTND